jgi:hypothetical protein
MRALRAGGGSGELVRPAVDDSPRGPVASEPCLPEVLVFQLLDRELDRLKAANPDGWATIPMYWNTHQH